MGLYRFYGFGVDGLRVLGNMVLGLVGLWFKGYAFRV